MKYKQLYRDEEWLIVWLGFTLIGLSNFFPPFPKITYWTFGSFGLYDVSTVFSVVILFFLIFFLFLPVLLLQKKRVKPFVISYSILFALAVLAHYLAAFSLSRAYGFGYAFWALFIGLFISNVVGVKDWLRDSLNAELMIKVGLVLLGAEILFTKMASLGLPALSVAWFVTPVVILFMYYFGTKYLRLDDKLSIVVATATSVCGVSAAIACSAACKAKKETLTLAVSMTLIFTVIMMVAMPVLVKALGMDTLVGGAWIGGTVDSTGAVVAAGAVLGKEAMDVAAIVKMIQNIMVGVVAFLVAIIWAKKQRGDSSEQRSALGEIWNRFPKFIIGFVGASLFFSFFVFPVYGEEATDELLSVSKSYRGLLFTMAFLSIGLESNFKELSAHLQNGKPVYLYIVGQSFNIILTLFVAYMAFGEGLFDVVK